MVAGVLIESPYDERVPEYLDGEPFVSRYIEAYNLWILAGFSEEKAKMRALEALKTPEDRSRLVERGGPGSGHFGHAGRPGKVGGSLPSGAGYRVYKANETPEEWDEIIKELAGERNFTGTIEFEPGDRPTFEVGDHEFELAGRWNSDSDQVRIWDETFPKSPDAEDIKEMRGLLAHELSHSDFFHAYGLYQIEKRKILDIVAKLDDWREGPIKSYGILKPEYQDEYPAYAVLSAYFEGKKKELLRINGDFTEYAEAHWEKYGQPFGPPLWKPLMESVGDAEHLVAAGDIDYVPENYLEFAEVIRDVAKIARQAVEEGDIHYADLKDQWDKR